MHDANEEKQKVAESIQRLKDLYSYVPREITIVDVIENLKMLCLANFIFDFLRWRRGFSGLDVCTMTRIVR